jgi:hypothetical protein
MSERKEISEVLGVVHQGNMFSEIFGAPFAVVLSEEEWKQYGNYQDAMFDIHERPERPEDWVQKLRRGEK